MANNPFGGAASRMKRKGAALRSMRRRKAERTRTIHEQVVDLKYQRHKFVRDGNDDKVREIDVEIAKLRALARFTAQASASRATRRSSEPVEGKVAPLSPKLVEVPMADMTVSVYLDTDDAVTVLRVIKATQRIADELGYRTPRIVDVERGSFVARFLAAWKGAKGQKVRAESLKKGKEIAQAGEQYGLLFVQDKQADVDQKNVSSAVELITACADIPSVAVKVGAVLFLKYPGTNGEPVIVSRTLSLREMAAYDKTPSICSDPSKLEENLAILVAQDEEDGDGSMAIAQ